MYPTQQNPQQNTQLTVQQVYQHFKEQYKGHVGLSLSLEGGAPVGVVLPEDEAERILQLFASRNLAGEFSRMGKHNVRCHPETAPWCVDTSRIIAITSFDPAAVRTQAVQQGAPAPTVAPPAPKTAVTPGPFPNLSRSDASGYYRPY